MSLQTKVIGRQTTDHGPYDPELAYGKKFQCTLFGCAWESKHDNNNAAPAVWDGGDTITPNLVDWKKVSGSYEAWLMNRDKPATSEQYPFNGMGRIRLQKNLVEVEEGGETVTKNLLTQAMFEDGDGNPLTNTIYVIQYDFTLGENITVPENCVLEFDGGSLSGAYTLTGNNTILEGRGYIFKSGVSFAGTFTIHDAKAEWFGVHPSNTDNAAYINAALKFVRSTQTRILTFNAGRFAVKGLITLGSDTDGESINRAGWDIVIEGAGQGNSLPTSAGGGSWGTTFALSDDGCFFVNQLSDASGWGRSGAIKNCSFVGEEGTERGIIINQCFPYEISNCYFYGLGTAISVTGAAYYCNIFNCRFRSNEYCIKTLTSEEEYYDANGANNNQVHNCTFQYNNYPIYLPVGSGWHIYDCDFEPENGTINIGSYNNMDNCRIERNLQSEVWLQVGSNCNVKNTSIISAGTNTHNHRMYITGKNNDIEIGLSGHMPMAVTDYGGENKINIKYLVVPENLFSNVILPVSDNITIEGVSNKLPTEQGVNLVNNYERNGGPSGTISYYPGISVGRNSQGATLHYEQSDYVVAQVMRTDTGSIIINNGITYDVPSTINDIYVIRKTNGVNTVLAVTGYQGAIVYGSASLKKPCFLGYDKSMPAIEITPDQTTVIHLSSLTYNKCFGGGNAVISISNDAIFMYKGQRYTYDPSNDTFTLYQA